MTTAFLGEIKMVGFNFAPRGWAQCNGQILAIAQNTALFSLLGTTYGGNGTTNYQLPNMQSRFPMHMGSGLGLSTVVQGEQAGQETVQILISNLPQHTHPGSTVSIPASNVAGSSGTPDTTSVLATSTARDRIYNTAPNTNLAPAPVTVGLAGSNIPVEIMPPYLVVNFIICIAGIFPSRN
jgi:microcystin-dependent protein